MDISKYIKKDIDISKYVKKDGPKPAGASSIGSSTPSKPITPMTMKQAPVPWTDVIGRGLAGAASHLMTPPSVGGYTSPQSIGRTGIEGINDVMRGQQTEMQNITADLLEFLPYTGPQGLAVLGKDLAEHPSMPIDMLEQSGQSMENILAGTRTLGPMLELANQFQQAKGQMPTAFSQLPENMQESILESKEIMGAKAIKERPVGEIVSAGMPAAIATGLGVKGAVKAGKAVSKVKSIPKAIDKYVKPDIPPFEKRLAEITEKGEPVGVTYKEKVKVEGHEGTYTVESDVGPALKRVRESKQTAEKFGDKDRVKALDKEESKITEIIKEDFDKQPPEPTIGKVLGGKVKTKGLPVEIPKKLAGVNSEGFHPAIVQIIGDLNKANEPPNILRKINELRRHEKTTKKAGSDKHKKLSDELSQIEKELKSQGYEFQRDMTGDKYVDGMTVKARFVEDASLPVGAEIMEVVRLGIMKDGVLVKAGEYKIRKGTAEPKPIVELAKEKAPKPKPASEYVYHNSTPSNIEGITKKGLLRELSDEYPHGVKDVPDNIKRVYFSDTPDIFTSRGGSQGFGSSKEGSLLRVKRSNLKETKEVKRFGYNEVWSFDDVIEPHKIEIYQNGQWRELAPKPKPASEIELSEAVRKKSKADLAEIDKNIVEHKEKHGGKKPDNFVRTKKGKVSLSKKPTIPPKVAEKPVTEVRVAREKPSHELSTDELVQRIKAQYPKEDAQSSYGRFVSARQLKPEINAKQYNEIFNRVGANKHIVTENVSFNPTHFDKIKKQDVMVSPTEHGNKFLWKDGSTGGDPGKLANRYEPLKPKPVTEVPTKVKLERGKDATKPKGDISLRHAGFNPFTYIHKLGQKMWGAKGDPKGRRVVNVLGSPEVVLEGRGITEAFREAKHKIRQTKGKLTKRFEDIFRDIKVGSKEDIQIFNRMERGGKLTTNEQKLRKLYDWGIDVANKHRIARGQEPINKLKNYMPHMIKYALEMEKLYQNLNLPKKLKFDFEKRKGATKFERSAIKATEAYFEAVLKDIYIGDALAKAIPLIEKLTVGKDKPIVTKKVVKGKEQHFYDVRGATFLTERAYAEAYIRDQLGWPTGTQKAIQALTRLKPKTQTKISQAVTFSFYRSLIGMALDTSVKNLTQGINTLSEFGVAPTLRGYSKLATKKGRAEIKAQNLLEEFEPLLQGGHEPLNVGKFFKKFDDVVLAGPMRFAEFVNRGATFHAALDVFLKKGMPLEKAIFEARASVRKLQFAYGRGEVSPYLRGPLARMGFQFTSFPLKQTELMFRWAREGKAGQAKLFRYLATSGALVLGGKYAGVDVSSIFFDPLRMVDPDSKDGIKLPGSDKKVELSFKKLVSSGFFPQGPAPVFSAPKKIMKGFLSDDEWRRKRAWKDTGRLFVWGGRYGTKVWDVYNEMRGEAPKTYRDRKLREPSKLDAGLKLTGLRSTEREAKYATRDKVAEIEDFYYKTRRKIIDDIVNGKDPVKHWQEIAERAPFLAEYLDNNLSADAVRQEYRKKLMTTEDRFYDKKLRKLILQGLK